MSFDDSTSVFFNPDNKLELGLKTSFYAGLLICVILTFGAARGDLWLDEIWSILFAETAQSPWDIVSLFKHDNNHLLNTVYLYVIGKQHHLFIYRLFSIAAGIGSLILLTTMAGKWGFLERIFVLVLAGFSYPLVLYFSEARGYAPAMFFSLLSLFFLEKCFTNYSTIKLMVFWLSLCLGSLSHLSFALIFIALSVSIIHREALRSSSLISKLRNVLEYLFVPSIFLVTLYLYWIRGMTLGGGDTNDHFDEVSKGIAYLLGMPEGFILSKLFALALFMSIALIGAYLYYRDGNKLWSFFLGILVLPPLAMIFITWPIIYYFRYLVVTFPFFYLLLSFLLGRLYRERGKYSYITLIILCLYLVGQNRYLLPLLRDGRGNYQAIVWEISINSGDYDPKVGSDHDFRNRMLLSFYQRFLPQGRVFHYVEQSRWNVETPEWIIRHSTDTSFQSDLFIGIPGNRVYKLVRSERFSGNSGFGWFLYHRISPGLGPEERP